MAKQFGVSDEALEGLKDPASHPFPPDQKAALLFAGAMTEGPGEVPEPIFRELRRHFDERQIVEIAAVVGLFNYFNRFNNALHVEITLMDPEVLAARLEQAAGSGGPIDELAQQAAGLLHQGRRYRGIWIYRKDGAELIREAWRGPDAPESGAGLDVPIEHQGRVIGRIVAAGERDGVPGDEDLALLRRAAAILAPGMARGA